MVGQSGDTLLPATVSGLTVNNNLGLILNQAETVTNLNLNGATLAGTVNMGSAGAFRVTGSNARVIGNVTLNSSALVLVASNGLPQLTVQGGTLALNTGGVVLTLLGSALPQGNYLLVDASSGGSVSGVAPGSATVNGAGLLAGLVGTPQIAGGKLYLSVVAFYAGYDAGAGFFSGENLITTNAGGMHLYAWSSADPGQPVGKWSAEGGLSEQPLNDGTGRSYYSINVTPVATPTYYVIGTTNGGPYNTTPVPVVVVTTPDYEAFYVSQASVGIGANGVLHLVPTVAINSGQLLPGGNFQLQFSGDSGSGYSILASTNLMNWGVIGSGTLGNGVVTFVDTNAVSRPARFYRISLP